MLNPDELRQLRRLSLQAGRQVDSLMGGRHRSAFKGQGLVFEEVRPYTRGDDVRHIDWKVTARAQAPHIKRFREERQQTLLLAVDVSGSMSTGSGGQDGGTDKALQMARVAGGLAYAATQSGDRVGLLRFSDQEESYLPPRANKAHAWGVIRALFEQDSASRGTDLATAIDGLARRLKRRTLLVLVSDFMDPGPWQKPLAVLASRHGVHAFLIHDPIETTMPGLGLVELQDAENGKRRLVDLSKFQSAHSPDQRLRVLAKLGVRGTAISTSEDPFSVLNQYFSKRRL